jgi:hypothetical protein
MAHGVDAGARQPVAVGSASEAHFDLAFGHDP